MGQCTGQTKKGGRCLNKGSLDSQTGKVRCHLHAGVVYPTATPGTPGGPKLPPKPVMTVSELHMLIKDSYVALKKAAQILFSVAHNHHYHKQAVTQGTVSVYMKPNPYLDLMLRVPIQPKAPAELELRLVTGDHFKLQIVPGALTRQHLEALEQKLTFTREMKALYDADDETYVTVLAWPERYPVRDYKNQLDEIFAPLRKYNWKTVIKL